MDTCERFKPLLMGLMDNELNQEELAEVNTHLQRCRACREEYDSLVEACAGLKGVSFREPGDEALRELWRSPFSRTTRVGGLVLLIGGYALLAGFGLFSLFTSGTEELVPKLAVAAMTVGVAVLFGSVLRERLKTWKTDPYKEVER